MKTIKYLFILLWGVLLISCQSDDWSLQKEETLQPKELKGDSIMVSSKSAENVATMFRKNSGEELQLKSTAAIKDITTICDENGEPSMYVINYANAEGFVIVSATRNYQPILAFSDRGSFNPYAQDMPLGVTEWVSEGKEIIKHQIGEQRLDSIAKFRAMWKMYETPNLTIKSSKSGKDSGGNLLKYDDWEKWEYYKTFNEAVSESMCKWGREGIRYETYDPNDFELSQEIHNMIHNMTMDYYPTTAFILDEYDTNYERIGPLLTTTWGQREPYDKFVPTGCPTRMCGYGNGTSNEISPLAK